jgi:G6PDH family F420-dependent oxidoreductase
MVKFGYTLMCEQRSADQLVADARMAEAAGFDFLAISDHIHPWLEVQGNSPFAWSVLGAVAQATTGIPLMTMVTCPIVRYHPVVVAQMAATVGQLSGGRFGLGVGSGENLNEHVVGSGWPSVNVRHEMLIEAIEIMRRLWSGGYQSYEGSYFTVDGARVFSLPERPIQIGMAAGGPEAARLAGKFADSLIASSPDPSLAEKFRGAGGGDKPRYAQITGCYAEDEGQAIRTAHTMWRYAVPGWKVMAELPNPANFEAATRTVRLEDVAEMVPCGPDVERHQQAIQKAVDAGFDHVAVVQMGPDQKGFCDFWQSRLRPRLQSLAAA